MGEPLRRMVDLPEQAEIVTFFPHNSGGQLIVASDAGDGFVVAEDDIVAQTRAGKQVLNVKDETRAAVCVPVDGDHVAVVSQNARLLVFPLSELPQMGRGKGVRLQKYLMARGRQGILEIDGGLSDVTTFYWEHGLSWPMGGGKTRTEPNMTEWRGKRASAGKRVPYGFPKTGKFS